VSPLSAAGKRKGQLATRECPECGRIVRACNLPRHLRVHTLSPSERIGPSLDEQRCIVEMYANGRGKTMDEIACEVLWSATVVWRVLHLHGAYVQHGGSDARLPVDERLRTAEMYARGMSTAMIGEILDRAPETIRRRLLRFGVQLRERGPIPQPSAPTSRHGKRRRKSASAGRKRARV